MIVSLDLSRNEFSSTLSDQVGNLARLTNLNVGNNYLDGTFPTSLRTLKTLSEFLDLSAMHVNYAAHASIILSAESFVAGSNQLSGHFLESVLEWTNLESLDVSETGLTGTIPTKFGLLQGLSELVLGATNLNGTLPTELGKLNLGKENESVAVKSVHLLNELVYFSSFFKIDCC